MPPWQVPQQLTQVPHQLTGAASADTGAATHGWQIVVTTAAGIVAVDRFDGLRSDPDRRRPGDTKMGREGEGGNLKGGDGGRACALWS